MHPVNIADIELLAEKKLTKMAYDHYFGGANDEVTLKENIEAYKKIFLKYRVLADVSIRNLSTSVLGQQISMPVVIAPTAFHKMSHPEGEVAVAKAAKSENTIMILSTLSNSDVEDVVNANKNFVWFQLYVYKDRIVTRELIKRVESAGVKALVLTVDAPVLGQRERDIRNGFYLPDGLTVSNLLPVSKEIFPEKNDSGLANYVKNFIDPSLSWKDIDWIRSVTELPLIIKGIGCKEDALKSVEYGADGIVVSNHGGRQLDTCRATINVLPEVAEIVNNKIEIYLDGGIRRGTDVIKALAFGAKAVLIGRPVIWGLAYDGENGVRKILDIFRNEIDLALALCGLNSVKNISKDIIA